MSQKTIAFWGMASFTLKRFLILKVVKTNLILYKEKQAWLKTKPKPKRKILCNEEKKNLNRESILSHRRGRSAPRPKCHAAKDKVNGKIILRILFPWNSVGRRCLKLVAIHWKNISHFPPPFPPVFSVSSEQDIVKRHLRHLLVTGSVKSTFTTVIDISRITFIACRPLPSKKKKEKKRKERKLYPIFFWGEGSVCTQAITLYVKEVLLNSGEAMMAEMELIHLLWK